MKRILCRTCCLMVLFLSAAWAVQCEGALPRTALEFETRYRQEGTTPEAAAKLFFDGIFAYMDRSTRAEGRKMLALAMDERPDWDGRATMKLFADRMKSPKTAHIFRSYARGAVPENGYAMDPDNYELVIERAVEGHPKGLQLYLRSGGADYPRVIYMKEVNGFWFIADGSTVKVEVRPPRK